jgi:hypothetical protein
MSNAENPFTVIESRLDRLENLLLELKERPTEKEPDDRCDINTVCELLGTPGNPVSRALVYGETHKGSMPHMRFGGRLIFSRRAVIEWRDSRTSAKEFKSVSDSVAASADKKFR